MRNDLIRAVFLLGALLVTQLFNVTAAQAAPGDFLFLWGSQQPHFSNARGIALDGNGNVYVAETGSIQVFNSAGVRIKKWGSYGSGDGQLCYPNGIAVDATGTVYVANTGNNRIEVFDSNGVFLRNWTHNAWWRVNGSYDYHYPFYVASDGRGKVYVSETGRVDDSVKTFDSEGNFLGRFGTVGTGSDQYDRPAGITIDANGNIVLVNSYPYRVQVFSPSGEFIRTAVSGFPAAGYVAVDKSGNVYLPEGTGFQYGIAVFDSTGNMVERLGFTEKDADQPRYWFPGNVAVDANGNVFSVSDDFGIRAFDPAGNPIRQWWAYGSGPGQLNRPQWLATDSGGNVYETDGHDEATALLNNRVQVFSPNGTFVRKITGDFTQTAGLTVDEGGNLYVLETTNPDNAAKSRPTSVVKVFDPAGNFLRQWGDPIPTVYGIAIDKSGNFLVTDDASSKVNVYDKVGNVIKSFGGEGAGDGQFSAPGGISVDNYGNIFVADTGNSRVQVFDSSYRFLRKWGGSGSGDGLFDRPAGIAVDGNGHVFVADSGNDRVQVFDSTGNFLGKWGSAGDDKALFGEPHGVVVNQPQAKVYVADAGNNRIQVFEGYPLVTYSLSGTVRDGGGSGAALAGATVAIAGKSATTSSTGAFTIGGLREGLHNITIARSGYVTSTVPGYVISGDKNGQTFTLRQAALYSMSGIVRHGSATGPVLAGATVTIAGKSGTTTSTGTFSIKGVPEGTHVLTVSKAGYATSMTVEYTIGGNQSGVVFYLARGYTLSGTLRDGSSRGALLPGAVVEIAGKTAITSSAGAFSIDGIPEGVHTLTMAKSGYNTKTVANYIMDRNKGAVGYYLLPVSYVLGGIVEMDQYTPVAGATVEVAGKSAITSSTGAFKIPGIPPGNYAVTISKPGFTTRTTYFAIYSNLSWTVFTLTSEWW